MTGKERIVNTVKGIPTDSLGNMPITMMFAADTAGISYYEYVTDHRKLVSAQILVAETFDIDHVSCISDPAREAADCGASVQFFPDQPPAMVEADALLADKQKLLKLSVPDPLKGKRMLDRVEAAFLFHEKVGDEKLIEGWVEGPCAEAADLRGINALMMDFYEDPAFVHDLFEFVLEMEIAFAKAQLNAGADMIGIGDAAASLVGKVIYEEFVFPFEKRLVDAIKAAGGMVRLHICGSTRDIVGKMGELRCEIVDLDYPVPFHEARNALNDEQVISANLAPVEVVRNGTPERIQADLEACYDVARPRFIVAAGCEIPRDTPPANLNAMTAFARSHRP